jgi:hypothetical protein
LGLKEISTTNEGDKRFASEAQASKSNFKEPRGFERENTRRFYERGMTPERADLRISFA